MGVGTLFALTSGASNTAIGFAAGNGLVSGSHNIYVRPGAVAANESNTIRLGGIQTIPRLHRWRARRVAYGEDGTPASLKYHILPTLLLAEVQRLERERAAL